jgi:hypothetical protein
MFYHFDPYYILYVALPLLVVSGLASLWVRLAYKKYSQIPNAQGITGAEAAQVILRAAGIHDVRVEEHQGWLSDHYDPRARVLRLSPQNYSGYSVAAVGIAAHESGHAIQHATHYAPLVMRNMAVPLASVGSTLGYVAIMIGVAMAYGGGKPLNVFTIIGLLLLAGIAVFQLINLPVEFDASRRALQVLPQTGILSVEETAGARSVLLAAAATYVAATAAAVLELLFWAWRLGLFSGGSNNRD